MNNTPSIPDKRVPQTNQELSAGGESHGNPSSLAYNLVLATAILSAGVLSAQVPPKDSGKIAPAIPANSHPENTASLPTSPTPKNGNLMTNEIWSAYDSKLKEKIKTSEKIREETGKWFSEILKMIGLGSGQISKKQEVALAEKSIDMYVLSKLGKEYLEKNKETLIQENNGKAILLAHYKNARNTRGQFILLPLPRTNPGNETIHVNAIGIPFALSPVPKSNGYNTAFQITSGIPGEAIQLALLYPLESSEIKNPKNADTMTKVHKKQPSAVIHSIEKQKPGAQIKTHQTKNTEHPAILGRQKMLLDKKPTMEQKLPVLQKYEYISYIPYIESHNTPKNQERGFEYLLAKMKKTYASVFQKKVSEYPSAAVGLSIGEALPHDFPLLLNIVERMDYQIYFERDGITLKDEKTLQAIMGSQIARSLTTFGLNEQDSFNWQKSSVGAAGIGQIMPRTYKLFKGTDKYGPLFPEPDFRLASQSHDTSFRLQVAHFDDQIYQFPKPIQQHWHSFITDEYTRVGINAMLAAGYNGNMKRVSEEVFGGLPSTAPLETFKARLAPDSIIQAMTRERIKKITLLNGEIQSLKDKIQKGVSVPARKGKNSKAPGTRPFSPAQVASLQGKIAQIQASITSITNTYKESMTYVKKSVFVTEYLSKNFPKSRKNT